MGTAVITATTADGGYIAQCTVSVESTGISELEESTGMLKLYPNPVVNGKLVVEIPEDLGNISSETIQIYDLNGKLVFIQNIIRPKTEINISHLSNGTYVVKMGATSSKIIKQ